MSQCTICGGRFARNKCAYCNKMVCTSCMVSEGIKCIRCRDRKTVPLKQFVRRNIILIIFLGTVWIYTIYPFPFLLALGFDVDMSAIAPVLIATIVLAIPFIIMLRVWQKRPPR